MIRDEGFDPRGFLQQTGGRAWYAPWPATVVDTNDPERRGRVRARQVHVYGAEEEEEFISDDQLPWALPATPISAGTGSMWVPEVGATVWMWFLGGSHEDPIYFGGWATTDDAIPEHQSSYAGGTGPATRVVKTPNGHIFEMRWQEGDVRVQFTTAAGIQFAMIDTPAGPKVLMQTPAGQVFTLDDAGSLINLAGTGTMTISAPGAVSLSSVTASLALSAVAGLLSLAAATITIAATISMTIGGPTTPLLTLATIGAPASLILGSVAGVKQTLATLAVANLQHDLLTAYNAHLHTGVTTGPGSSGPTNTPVVPGAGPTSNPAVPPYVTAVTVAD